MYTPHQVMHHLDAIDKATDGLTLADYVRAVPPPQMLLRKRSMPIQLYEVVERMNFNTDHTIMMLV